MSDKAKRAIITVAGIEVEVFQLVDLRYVMSQAQAVKAIDEKESLIRQFLTSKQAKYLPSNDYRIDIPTVNDTKGRGGNNRNIMGLTITIASTFWLSRAMKDNPKAEALMYALALEALDRRCDTVFEVVKTEAQYEQQTLSAYEEYRQSREYLITIKNPATGSNREKTFRRQLSLEQRKTSEGRYLSLISTILFPFPLLN
ncbi:MAG: hypothetical protein V7L26_30015 [Nostoc sp.]|uniref:hypothetical protein n=1 Tax=Nostoc sp. TaxID=1180 RepID=UPI002FF74DE7